MITVVGSMAARVARHRAVGKSYSLIPRQRESIGLGLGKPQSPPSVTFPLGLAFGSPW